MVVDRGWGRGRNRILLFDEDKVSVLQNEKNPVRGRRPIVVIVAQQCECILTPPNGTLKMV